MIKLTIRFMLLLLAGNIQAINASETQSISSIQDSVREYVANNLTEFSDYELSLGKIDNRLQLPLCSVPLAPSVHNGALKPGRNSIAVKCQKNKAWTVYTSAVISIYKKVAVLSESIHRGEILNQHKIRFERKNISTLRSGYFIDPQLILNKQAIRNIREGTVVNKSNFVEPRLIKRGERINIKASSPNLNISMAGISMMDGVKGQNIRVKNITSQQIIQATVVRTGVVEVMF